MRLSISLIFLTFVLIGQIARSAPAFEYRPAPVKVSLNEPTDDVLPFRNVSYDWALRLGTLSGAFSETSSTDQLYYYGLRYSFYRQSLSSWELEISTGGNNFLHITAGKKFYFPLEEVTLPYYKISVGDLVDSSENLASVFNIKKIQAIAAVGLDDLFLWNQRLQGELAIGYALVGPQYEVSIGFAF